MSESVVRKIEEMGEHYQKILNQLKEENNNLKEEKVNELKSMNSRLQDQLNSMLAKNGTSFGNASSQEMSLKADVAKAVSENAENIGKFISRAEKKGSLDIEVKDMSLANFTGGQSALDNSPVGIVGATTRLFHVRDLLPKITMTTASLPIIRDNGHTGTFTPVAEGAVKPIIDFSLAETPAKAEVIAGIANVTRQFLEDLGPIGVQSWLTSRLTELYLIAEDDQLLNGNGVSPNLKGLNNAGNFTAATATGNATGDHIFRIVQTLIQMRSLQRTARAIVIHPNDLADIFLNTSSSGEFNLPSYFSVNAQGGLSVLGVPILDTVAQTAGQYNVLDNTQMLMGIRENLNIRFFEEDGNNVRTNRITVRAEARVAFATYGAVNNIKGTFSA